MTTQPEQRTTAEVCHLDIRIGLTGRTGDAAHVAARLATALHGLASVDVTAVRPSA
jgi:hypothetical protein